jgi:hypothetical protein
MRREEITADLVRSLMDYNEETGLLTWKIRRGGTANSGRVVSTVAKNGYVVTSIKNVKVYAHRIAWLHKTGEMPTMEIDHMNGIRTDNRFCNLRLASRSLNTQNMHNRRSDNRSGHIGVSYHKATGLWRSRIHLGGKEYAAYFKEIGDAVADREKKKKLFHPGAVDELALARLDKA